MCVEAAAKLRLLIVAVAVPAVKAMLETSISAPLIFTNPKLATGSEKVTVIVLAVSLLVKASTLVISVFIASL